MLAVIGGGNMGAALVHGLLRSGRKADSIVVCEISPEQAAWAAELAAVHFADVEVRPDLAGRDRVLLARHLRAPRGPGVPVADRD